MSNLLHRYHHLTAANLGLKDKLDHRSGLIEDVLTRVVIQTMRRYQERLHVGMQDSVADLLASFRLKVADEIYRLSQNWMAVTHRQAILFPPDCRFLYTLGASTIVVVEQAPAVRTLSLDRALLQRGESGNTGLVETHALAMPYTVFLIHSRNAELDGTGKEKFCNLYIGWRALPLTSLGDVISTPFLPNLYPSNYTVCTGYTELVSECSGGAAITELTSKVITGFWSSVFNSDLSSNWWRKETWAEISSVGEWEQNSRRDPLFILAAPLHKPTPLAELIQTISIATEDKSPETVDLRHRITEITDGLSDQLFRGLKNYIHKTKFDRFYPKDITDQLAAIMEDATKQLRVVAFGIEMQLNEIKSEVSTLRRDHYGWKKRSPWWIE